MGLTTLAQDSNRDFLLVNGVIQTTSDAYAALVLIDNTVRGQYGEYRYDQTAGIDYTGNVFGAAPNYQLFEAQVRQKVSNLSFVESIDDFEYTIDTDSGELSYSMTVTTIYGTETI